MQSNNINMCYYVMYEWLVALVSKIVQYNNIIKSNLYFVLFYLAAAIITALQVYER